MKVVLDANVILAALITEGLCHALAEQCLNDHRLCTSDVLRDEVIGKLERKFHASSKLTAQARVWLDDSSEIFVPVPLLPESCRDPKDVHVLGLAVAANADCLVTGDRDLLVLKNTRTFLFFPRASFIPFCRRNIRRVDRKP